MIITCITGITNKQLETTLKTFFASDIIRKNVADSIERLCVLP